MVVIHARSSEEWRQAATRSFVPLHVASSAPQFRGTIDHRLIGPARLSVVSSTACTVERTKTLIDSSASDDLLVSIRRRGSNVVSQEGRSALIGPGAGVLYVSGDPYRLAFARPGSELVLQVPRRETGLSRDRVVAMAARSIPGDDTRLRVLRAYCESMLEQDEDAVAPSEAFGRIAAELLTTLLRGMEDRHPAPTSAEALLVALRTFIADHLTDPRLDVPYVARAHARSIRSVHAAFGELDVGPAEYIRNERLRLAADMLRTGGATVADIAHGCGFVDTTTFARAFRRHYGCAPSEYRVG